MYLLPPDFDPAQFVGRELEQVSFTVNTVSLNFEGDASITVLSDFIVNLADGSAAVRQAPPVGESRLMTLLGRKVVSAEETGRRILTLTLEQGAAVTCVSDSGPYEAFTLRIGGREIIV